MIVLERIRSGIPVAARIIAAVVGGYMLAALFSVAAVALPISRPQAVLAGMLASFPVYAGAIIWAFVARSALRAWVGLLAAAVPLALIAWAVAGGIF